MANLRVDKITSTETFETTGSVQFNHNNDNYLSGTITAIGTQDFTIECWVYLLANRAAHQRIFGNDDGAFDSNTLNMRFTPNLAIQMYYGDQGSVTSHKLSESRWYHIAMSYSDNIARCYVDGKEFSRIIGNTDLGNTTMFIGGTYTVGGENFNGHVSNARLIVGKGIYPENFKPPMRELEVTPETVLLACQSKTDKLEERSGNTTLSATGILHSASELTPGLLTPIPKAGAGSAITGSVEFDGSGPTVGGYLEVTPDDDLQFLHKCTDSYTVEAWVHKQASTQGTIFDNGGSSSTTIGIILFGDSGGVLKFRARQALSGGGFHSIQTGNVMANDMWHHVALTYDKSTVRLFVNGILAGSTSYSTESSVDSTQSFKIGAYEYGGTTKDGYFNGHISNLRVVKGTALYTDNFIPPTRELKKIPGTVLLCCQDPDNPLTEATGKTITGYGDLQRTDDVELITNGSFAGDFTGWSNGNPTQFTYSTNSVGGDTSGKVMYYAIDNNLRTFTQYVTCVTGQKYILSFDASSDTASAMVIDIDGTNVVTIDDNNNSALIRYNHIFTAGSTSVRIRIESQLANRAYFDNFSVKLFDGSNKGSNFTPQVGDDRKVTFEGVTKVNSDAYFYLPTGDTVTRESRYGRGLIVGGSNSNAIEYINISTLGNSQDYGDLSAETSYVGALASSTRGVYSRSRTPSSPSGDNTLEYSTLATTSNSIDFGDRTVSVYEVGALSNNTRGIIGGGYGSDNSDLMDYVTIASTGDAIDFGNLTQARRGLNGLASPTRGCFAAGYQQPDTTTETDIIDYVTIASTGNALDFGDLIAAVWGPASLASPTRGIWAGGIDPNATAVINYVTISSTGNAQDFGDLTVAKGRNAGMSNSTRGVIGLEGLDAMDYITIATTGNAKDFGDMMRTISGVRGACSDSHGGLG